MEGWSYAICVDSVCYHMVSSVYLVLAEASWQATLKYRVAGYWQDIAMSFCVFLLFFLNNRQKIG